jgi:hypothetical protein
MNRQSSAVVLNIAMSISQPEVDEMYSYKDENGDTHWTGCKLKFYYDDFHLYSKEYDMGLSEKDARRICKKLCRHFKVRVWLGFKKGRSGLYRRTSYSGGEIFLPIGDTDLGLLCHEISHAIHHQRYHKRGHTRQLRRIMDRVVGYCRKKNYWKESSIFDFFDIDCPVGAVGAVE